MNKIKLFKCGNCENIHDGLPNYFNVIPLSKKGIQDWCEVVKEDEANYFYFGQFSDQTTLGEIEKKRKLYEHLPLERVIVDIEGDWLNKKMPEWLKKCILTINGASLDFKSLKAFVRPTFSTLLIHLKDKWDIPKYDVEKRFIFRGFPDPHGVRSRIKAGFKLTNIPHIIELTDKWNGPSTIDSEDTQNYIGLMNKGLLALAPRGCGHDSVRYLEACWFGRVPIVIGDNLLVGEDYYDTSFCYKISQFQSISAINAQLFDIFEESDSELLKKARNARKYFDEVVRTYFKDPTLMFLNWLKRNKY